MMAYLYKKSEYGQGVIINLEGIHYEGEFNLDKIEGKGVLYFNNGTHFVGIFTRSEDNEIQAIGHTLLIHQLL